MATGDNSVIKGTDPDYFKNLVSTGNESKTTTFQKVGNTLEGFLGKLKGVTNPTLNVKTSNALDPDTQKMVVIIAVGFFMLMMFKR